MSHALCIATQDGRVMVESPDKTWSAGEGNGKPLQYSCLENPMNSMKDWWWGKVGLALVGRVLLSKALIQLSVDGWGCTPSLVIVCLFGL